MEEVTKTLSKLNEIYKKAEEADKELFAEQRSNILLVSGDHYSKGKSRFWDRIRDSKDISEAQKLKITKNHIQKISKTLVNNIISQSPGVKPLPANENDIQDQKAATLNNSVWQHLKKKRGVKKLIPLLVSDFVDIGECAAKIFWDVNAGDLVGFQQAVDENGEPVYKMQDGVEPPQYELSEDGAPIPQKSETPVFAGAYVCERVFCFNLLRAPQAKTMAESPYLIYRKMMDKEDLKVVYKNDEAKLKMIQECKDETYVIFDAQKANHSEKKGQVCVKEIYYRPCLAYPEGYFYIYTEFGILEKGKLPASPDGTIMFPIIYAGYDELKTTPRHRSIIKQLRPYQAEINREASQMAANSILHGDDKVYTQSGSKIAPAASLPGARQYTFTGTTPTVIPGRTGEQFLGSIAANISEMYSVANLPEDNEEVQQSSDPYNLLFRSVKDKKKFVLYAQKIEEFLTELCQLSLEVFKAYADENQIIPVIGKKEMVNIQEFKSADKLSTKISIEPMADDIEDMIGKQLSLNHIIQYAGGQLDKEEIGKIMRAMPFANVEEAFDDITIDYDNVTNDILALERGEYPPTNKYDKHEYAIKHLVHRKKQSDFRFLDPQIQGLFEQKIAEHEQIGAQFAQELAASKNEFIPVDGSLITVQMKVKDPSSASGDRQVKLPYMALDWLLKQLDRQGTGLDKLESMNNQGAQVDIANMMQQQAPQPNM